MNQTKVKPTDTDTFTFEVLGDDDLQYYYVNLQIGDSRQPQAVIVDTGSDLTAFPCRANAGDVGTHKHAVYTDDDRQSFRCDSKLLNYTCDKCDRLTGKCIFAKGYAEGSQLHGDLI